MATERIIHQVKTIAAPRSRVWETLTDPALIRQWLAGPESSIQAISAWKTGSPIRFEGSWHGTDFADKGMILEMEKEKCFRYSYWSRLSKLPDVPENYTLIEFVLLESTDHTLLELTQTNLLTNEIYGHWNYYWLLALEDIRRIAETTRFMMNTNF